MSINTQEMMRQIVCYAHEEMRNRGLEEAAAEVERRSERWRNSDRYDARMHARAIRALKRDPAKQLSDWWGPDFAIPEVPMLIPALAD